MRMIMLGTMKHLCSVDRYNNMCAIWMAVHFWETEKHLRSSIYCILHCCSLGFVVHHIYELKCRDINFFGIFLDPCAEDNHKCKNSMAA